MPVRSDEVSVPLSRLPRRLRRPLAVSLGLGVLNELSRLHQAGHVHGALEAKDVRIGLDGSVRLVPRAAAAPESERERSAARLAEVRAAGAILCRLMGTTPAEPAHQAGEAALLKTARQIANLPRQKRPGYEAVHASLMLWEAAGRLGTQRAQAQAAVQLGALAAARREARSRPTPPVQPAAPTPVPRGSSAPRPPALLVGGAVLLVAALAAALWSPRPALPPAAVAAARVQAAPAAPVLERDDLRADPAPATSPTPRSATVAAAAPQAAGDVRSVSLVPVGSCASGELCHLQVRVGVTPAGVSRSVSWVIETACTADGSSHVLDAGGVRAAPGWTLVIGDAFVTPPSVGVAALTAVVNAPARAVSTPLPLTARGC